MKEMSAFAPCDGVVEAPDGTLVHIYEQYQVPETFVEALEQPQIFSRDYLKLVLKSKGIDLEQIENS